MKRALVVDVEGTTSSIAFVKDTLFPHARRALPAFVRARGEEPEVRRWLDAAAADLGPGASDDALVEALQGWIDADRKHTALKALQGLIWREGYESGAYLAHLYGDAVAQLRAWRDAGHGLYIYSSGSVEAQKLFFAHSVAGDLTSLLDGYFDTVTGAKRDADSYRRIAGAIGLPPEHITFLSDVVEELDAAREAGLRTFLVDRREDYPRPREGAATHGHARVESFADIDLNESAADSA